MNIATSTSNCGGKVFYRENCNTRAQTVRVGRGLAGSLATLMLVFLTPRVAMGALDLDVDVGTQTLIGNDSTPQAVSFYVNNTSGSPITVGGLDFFIELGTGSGTTPSISSVDLLTDTIFANNNEGQHADSGNGVQLQYYSVVYASAPAPEIPTGSSLLATVSFVTAGTASGS